MSDWDASSDDGAAAPKGAAANRLGPASAAPASASATGASHATSKPVASFGGRKRFEDEDAEDDVQDDWDAEEEEPERPDVSNLQPIKKKSTIKQKIKEREEEERRRAELGLGSDDDDDEEDEDPIERRRREKEAQIKADVENAANLLGTSKINADEGTASLRNAKPQSKEDWDKFSSELYGALIKNQAGRPGFDKYFVPSLCKLLSEPLRDVDCRKQSTEWKKLADDKTKAEKEKKLGGGKRKVEKPKQVGTASAKNTYDTRAYGDEALDVDDDLDFM